MSAPAFLHSVAAPVEKLEARVLVVDDDDGIRRAVGRQLTRLGCRVDLESDPRNAAQHVRAARYDLVISDISMPYMTGLDLIRAVRVEDADLPVALMTGAAGLETAMQAVTEGVFSYLTKPFEPARLAAVVKRALEARRRAQRVALAMVDAQAAATADEREAGTLESAVAKLWMAFQPIVDWPRREIFGQEALLRTKEAALGNPAKFLEAAERHGRVWHLGRAIRGDIAVSCRGRQGLIFVNLHPSDLEDPDLYDPSTPLGAMAGNVVLEITERASLNAISGLRARVDALKAIGFRLAVDDLGAGWASLSSLAQIEPDFIKLDLGLVRGLDGAPVKRSIVRTILGFGRQLGMRVIAEGVETTAERDVLAGEGCELMQGYLFGRPSAEILMPSF